MDDVSKRNEKLTKSNSRLKTKNYDLGKKVEELETDFKNEQAGVIGYQNQIDGLKAKVSELEGMVAGLREYIEGNEMVLTYEERGYFDSILDHTAKTAKDFKARVRAEELEYILNHFDRNNPYSSCQNLEDRLKEARTEARKETEGGEGK